MIIKSSIMSHECDNGDVNMANVCDYNSLTHYESGSFNKPFRTELAGNLQITEKSVITKEEDLNSFKDQYYKTCFTLKDLVFYRVYGRFQRRNGNKVFGSKLTGAFVTTEFAESIYDVKMRVALDQLWGNSKMFEAKILVPAGTKINVGIVAPVMSKSGAIFPGGADQIMMPLNWPKEWVIGYRRVSTRQLQKEPVYTEGIPEDRIMYIEDLYKPRTCPLCGSTDNIIVYHGADADYGPVVCEDGSTCIARFHCLNKDCLYYW